MNTRAPVSVRTALASSLNVPAVRTLILDASTIFAIGCGTWAIAA